MAITRSDIAAHLERDMRVGFLTGSRQYLPKRSAFARETSSDGAFESYADLGTAPWPASNGGNPGRGADNQRTGAPSAGGMNSGGSSVVFGTNEMSLDVYNLDWDVVVGVSHTAIEDDRVGSLREWAQNAGQRFQQHMDWLCFDALNKGDIAGSPYGVGYDKQPLFSASHIDPMGSYQVAQSNLLTTALTMNDYEALQIAASNLRDDRNQPAGLSFPLLIVPPALQRIASQITGNDWVFSTPNREINPYSATTRLLVAPGGYLDSTAWYVISDSLMSKPIILQIRQQPRLVSWDDYSDGGGVRYFKWIARYNVAYGNWRTAFQGNT